jgi:hypothetical protein
MSYNTHVLTLVFAGIFIGIGAIFILQNLPIAIVILLIGVALYLYGYNIKRR